MAKKLIRPIRSEADYNAALNEIERYFDDQPKRGTPEADRSRTMSAGGGPSRHRIRSIRFVTGWRRAAILKPTLAACLARASVRPTF